MGARASIIRAHLLVLRTHMLGIMTNENAEPMKYMGHILWILTSGETNFIHFGQNGGAGDVHIKWLLDATHNLLQGQ